VEKVNTISQQSIYYMYQSSSESP